MTERLPRVTAGEAIRALEKQDFHFHGKAGVIRSTKIKRVNEQLFLIIQARFFIPRP